MSTMEDVLRFTLIAGVEGEGASPASSNALDGLDWQLAGRRVPGAPYTIQQSANHIIYWNGFSLAALAAYIREGNLEGKTPSGRRLRADVLRGVGSHVSYHFGQIALLRRMLGAWPPRGGGDTW